MSDQGRLVAGRYRLVRRIGAGAMGAVWEAQDERLNRTVAVKKLLLAPNLPADEAREAVERCMREGRIAAKLHHPNAITVFDVVDDDNAPCLIMEYLPSESLADVLRAHGPLRPDEVARIGSHIASALAAAHAAGIVHRDIKPANVLLGDDGVVKITDFGISRANDDVTVTKTGMIAGTPAYLAPEVAIGKDPTAASDVFSLGSLLYAAVEGEPPFGLSENTLGLLHAVAAGKINLPKQAGPMTPVLVSLLSAEPDDRPTAVHACEMLTDVSYGDEPNFGHLATVVQSHPAMTAVVPSDDRTQVVSASDPAPGTTRVVTAAPAPAGEYGDYDEIGPQPQTRSRGPLIVTGLALAIIAGFGIWFFTGNRPENPHTDPTKVVETTTQPLVPGPPQPSEEPTTTYQRPTTTTTRPTTTTTTTTMTTTTTTSSKTTTTPPTTSSTATTKSTTPTP